MNRCIARMCVAILLSAVPVSRSQTAAPTPKPRNEETIPLRQAPASPSLTNAPARRLHSVIEKDSETEFLRLVSQKQTSTDDIRSIRRLFLEKQAVLKKIDDSLASDYAIDGDRNYRYDTSSKTIYELPATPGTNVIGKTSAKAGDSVSSNNQGRVHLVLKDKSKADTFVQLTTAKQLNSTIIKVLALLDQEKEDELARQNNALLSKFKVSKDRSYEYDAKSSALYELTTAPEDDKRVKR